MANQLFQSARQAVHRAETSAHAAITPEEIHEARNKITAAQNDLSSAFANSSMAEREQLQSMQQILDDADLRISQSDSPRKY